MHRKPGQKVTPGPGRTWTWSPEEPWQMAGGSPQPPLPSHPEQNWSPTPHPCSACLCLAEPPGGAKVPCLTLMSQLSLGAIPLSARLEVTGYQLGASLWLLETCGSPSHSLPQTPVPRKGAGGLGPCKSCSLWDQPTGFFFFLFFFTATPAACGSSPTRGRIGAAAASLQHWI